MEGSRELVSFKENGHALVSMEGFYSPRSLEKSAPLTTGTELFGLEMDLFAEMEAILLLSCPASEVSGKERALQLVEEFNHYVGLSSDGYGGKLSVSFAAIIANNEGEWARFQQW